MVPGYLGHVGSTYSYSVGTVVGMGESLVFTCGGRRAVTNLHTFLYNVTFDLLMALAAGEKPCKYYVL